MKEIEIINLILAVDAHYRTEYVVTNLLALFLECLLFILPVVISLWVVQYKRNKKIRENHIVKEDYQFRIDNVEKFKKLLPNAKLKDVKKQLYDKFYKIQIAKANYDYDSLRELCTDELYNMYKAQLQVLDMKAHKHIIDDFKLVDIRVYDASEVNGLIQLDVYISVNHLDYVEDLDDKYIVKGHPGNYVNNRYIMSFVRKADNTKEQRCPDCGAVVKSHSTTCEYCRGKIVTTSDDFILSKKTKIATMDEVMS